MSERVELTDDEKRQVEAEWGPKFVGRYAGSKGIVVDSRSLYQKFLEEKYEIARLQKEQN